MLVKPRWSGLVVRDPSKTNLTSETDLWSLPTRSCSPLGMFCSLARLLQSLLNVTNINKTLAIIKVVPR